MENKRIQMQKSQDRLPHITKKPPMREITNSGNKLAGRLFRNSSLNRINPNSSILSSSMQEMQPSFMNCSTQSHSQSQSQLQSYSQANSHLVASISLTKLKKSSNSQPYLEISNGKFLMGKQQHNHHTKKMFRKLDKLAHSASPFNKILPDELIDYPIEKDTFQQSKIKKKSTLNSPKSKSSKIAQQYDNNSDLLVPEDFIQLLQQDKNIKNQFCYLQKMKNPYDLKIVQFHQNADGNKQQTPHQYPSEYITISSRGVTYFSEQQSRFVPLEEWKKQANYFRKIIKLDFFKNFELIKNFSNWKKYLRKSAMKSTIQKLKQKLVINDKFLRNSLLDIRRICEIMETNVSYCRIDEGQKVANFKQFKASQQVFIQNEFERRIFQLQDNIKDVLINNLSNSMKEFKEENKISSSVQGKGMPLLIGDEKNLQMPYTKQATLRTQQQKFQKFIKLIDLLITHSKVNMMSQSTNSLAKKIDEQNQNYKGEVVQSGFKNTYKGKQYLECVLTLQPIEPYIYIRPTQQDMTSLFEDIVNRSVVRLCRNHKKISSDIDVLSVIYDSQDQFPKDTESESIKVIMTSDGRQEDMLQKIMGSVEVSYQYIVNYANQFTELAKINFENMAKMQEINNFLPKDFEMIKNLIQKWHKQKDIISTISKEHDGPLFQLNLKQFKQKAERTTNSCINKVKQVIPKIFQKSIQDLKQCLSKARDEIQEQPIGVQALIQFNQSKFRISIQIQDYSSRMLEISCLDILMRNISPSNAESNNFKRYQKQIKQLQSSLNNLRRKIDQADMNNKLYESRAQDLVKQMAPKNKSKLAEVYAKIQAISRQKQPIPQMNTFISKKQQQIITITQQFHNIRSYQHYLNLEQFDETEINNFTNYFNVLKDIWRTAYQFQQYVANLQQSPWGSVKTSEVNTKLQEFGERVVNVCKTMKKVKQVDAGYHYSEHDEETVKSIIEKVEEIRPLVETIQSLNDKCIGEKQMNQIKYELSERNQKLIEVLQKNRNETKTKQLIESQAVGELDLFKGAVAKAKKNSKIAQKMQAIKAFTNFSKNNQVTFRNLTDSFKQSAPGLFEQIEEKLIMINFIQEQAENHQRQKSRTDKITLQKLKQLLILWDRYEKHVQYFQPIYTFTDWKNTPQGKLFFAATQQNWKKTYKGFRDSSFSKVLSAERVLPSLKESNQILESLYQSITLYMSTKRAQCGRFCFLSDKQIINLYSQGKDFKGLNSSIQDLFPSIKQIDTKQDQLVHSSNVFQVISCDGQILPVKAGRASSISLEVDEMVKMVEEGMRLGVKASIKNCHISFDTEQFNKLEWITKNHLQSLVFVTGAYFTRIIEQDYLCTDGEDLQKLQNYHISQIQILKQFLLDQTHPQITLKKLSILLIQALSLRDSIKLLIDTETTSKQSHNWLKQTRHYYNSESLHIEYSSNVSVLYGNQLTCLSSTPLINLLLTDKSTLQIISTLTQNKSVAIVGKPCLQEICAYNGKLHQKAFLNAKSQFSFVEDIVLGTWLTGAFTDITLQSVQNGELLSTIAQAVQDIMEAAASKQPYIRGVKNIALSKQSGIALISPSICASPVPVQMKVNNRIISIPQIPWEVYLNVVIEVNCMKVQPNLVKDLAKNLEELQEQKLFWKFARKDVKKIIDDMDEEDKFNEEEFGEKVLKEINKKCEQNNL